MATMLTSALRAFVVTLAIANAPNAIAQTASAPPSVLPTGGGQALLDTSDSVILLLDHQSGLFQTVKDVDLVQLRANVTMLAKLADALENSGDHDGVGAWRAERTADARDSSGCAACGVCAAQG